MVPADMQRDVYATVKQRGRLIGASWAPWWRAQARAIHAIMQAEGRDAEKLAKWFEKEMKVAAQMESWAPGGNT